MTSVFLALAGCSRQAAPTDPADTSTAAASLREAAAPVATASPSFACAKADTRAMQLVCGDAELAALDREMARLYALASKDGPRDSVRQEQLRGMQRGWIKGRDECWKADDLRRCVFSSYSGRISDLRQGYAPARSDDAKGISEGPFSLACDETPFAIGVTFLRSDPGGAFLQWKDQAVALERIAGEPGTTYRGVNYAGEAVLTISDDDARVTLPGETEERHCRIEGGG
ncbi:hypothetical protein B2G71_05430 [Novosphingobium sp. PC22D]|nr:hypothetical protein B2G71_05430 [Novosphingobium sp. PC22D]